MPELPEITSYTRQMQAELVGKTIQHLDILQPKCLNMPGEEFCYHLAGATILSAANRGKWVFLETDKGFLLLNLGMGGEVLLVPAGELPEKRRLVFYFTDGNALAVNFWWFGYAHFVERSQLSEHGMTARLGPNALDIPLNEFSSLLRGSKGRLKSVLLDQSKLAGIGNFYIHDILFLARLHPLRAIPSLSNQEIAQLHQAIELGLRPSQEKGGAFYEKDLYGQPGGYTMDDVLVGYKDGKPCPRCGSMIEKIKTGSTSSFICPNCQTLS